MIYSMINYFPNLPVIWLTRVPCLHLWNLVTKLYLMVVCLYAVLCFTLLVAWFDPHKIERSVAIKLYFHANLWKRLIEFCPPVQRRLGVQVSGAVKYPVLEVKWQQKLWLEPWNNQSRCFDCWEPAKNCPGFAAARAPANSHQTLNPSRENSCFYPPRIIHHTLHRGCKVAMMLQ